MSVVITKRRVVRAICARLSRLVLRTINLLAGEKRQICNACGGSTVGFWTFEGRPFGCPRCLSSSRERFVVEELEHGRLSIPDSARVLHVAPSEHSIHRIFCEQAYECICADIDPSTYPGMEVIALDLTTLAARSDIGVFDIIYASHVLEHVHDLEAALEGIRVRLSHRGQAWFLFPIGSGLTEEDPYLQDPVEREKRFGQWDHVRLFGEDAKAIIEKSGFHVSILEAGSLPASRVDRLGLDPNDKIFICTPRPKSDW